MVPAFTPYLEIPRLDRYDLDVIELHASAVDDDGDPTWQFPDAEIDKLADPAVQGDVRGEPVEPAVGDARAGDARRASPRSSRPATRI